MTTSKLYMRCPYCGDSQKHPDKKHLVVFLDSGSFHCYRCNESGYLTISELLQLVYQEGITGNTLGASKSKHIVSSPPPKAKLLLGIGPLNRYSGVMKRYLLEGPQYLGPLEVFESKNRSGQVTGFHLRASWEKKTLSFGSMSLGYGQLDFTRPVRLVEGPYDVIGDQDTCLWGMPSTGQLQGLKFTPLILTPDSDIFDDMVKFRAWFKPIVTLNLYVTYVELLPSGLDPDECSVQDRVRLPWTIVHDIYKGAQYGNSNSDSPRVLVAGTGTSSSRKIFLSAIKSRSNFGGSRHGPGMFLQRSS